MKILFIFLTLIPIVSNAQKNTEIKEVLLEKNSYIKTIDNLTLDAAYILTKRATEKATALGKKVTIAILDASGNIILLVRADGVGIHNTEAARRKAYTALSTRTPTLELLRNAEINPDTRNLNTIPELLLLSGGSPIWYKGNVVGSIGVAGGGGPDNDDLIAKSAILNEIGITTTK
ncbi:heme-binding protein [Flavobacterium sinopsychrotolerans]|uniref:Uncharacterized conserved protein GlcG, DUF336 family n=1 Tax=Flavobacterium sinopsychrotolerans TaxID=604089 RepID=A0A1H8LB88_9FLAO|nr:heme-binding protein [Flavobacterium sinopsychrotolerans]SEO01978.1 Uncharacterized conserved protein GlcG, DUF336 family [Flavobacterium sinopsychrotolerans]